MDKPTFTSNWVKAIVLTATMAVASLPQPVLAAGPEVAMAITPPEGPLTPGEAHIYRVNIANKSTVAATGALVVEVNIPQFVAVNDPGNGGSCSPSECNYGNTVARHGSIVSWKLGSIPAGGMNSLIFRAVVDNSEAFPAPDSGTVVAVAGRVKSGTLKVADGEAKFSVEHTAPGLDVALTGSTETQPGDTVTYVAHFGNTTGSATNGILELALPAGLKAIEGSEGATVSGNKVKWDLGAVASGHSDTRTVKAVVSGTVPFGTLLMPAVVARSKQGAASEGQMVTWVAKDKQFTLDASVTPNPAKPGNTMVYALDVANHSASAASGAFQLWAAVPHFTTVEDPQKGSCFPQDCTYGTLKASHGNWVEWKVASIPASGVTAVQFAAKVLKPETSAPPPNGSLMVTEFTTNLPNGARLRHVAAVGTSATVGSGKTMKPIGGGSTSAPVASQPKPSAPVAQAPESEPADQAAPTEPKTPFLEELDRPVASGPNARTPEQRNSALLWSRYCVAKWRVKQWDKRCSRRWQKRADWKAQEAFWKKHTTAKK